jgi:hypothetical protein
MACKSSTLDPESAVEHICLADSIAIKTEDIIQKKRWELPCLDTSSTTTDINLCSYECFLVSDSLLNHKYETLIESYEKSIGESTEYSKLYTDQRNCLINLQNDFLKTREDLGILIESAMGTARERNFRVNMYKIGITDQQLELYTSLDNEILFTEF